jgi:hypothetical protein
MPRATIFFRVTFGASLTAATRRHLTEVLRGTDPITGVGSSILRNALVSRYYVADLPPSSLETLQKVGRPQFLAMLRYRSQYESLITDTVPRHAKEVLVSRTHLN